MRSIWAVARHTLSQCLRMRVAVMFMILLGIWLAVLPTMMEGDGTLAGKIRTFLAYGLSATRVLLILVTIFVSTGAIASDIRTRQIFTIATKPLSRWQYIVGRWLGVVMLDVVLLALAASATLAMVRHLHTKVPFNASDHRAVETEVFAARRRLRPEPSAIERLVAERIEKAKRDGRYAKAIDELMTATSGDADAAAEMFRQEVRKQEMQKLQSVPPGGVKRWRFTGVKVSQQRSQGEGRITHVDPAGAVLRIETARGFAGRLIERGPVEVEGVGGQVLGIGWDFFVVRFEADVLGRMPRAFAAGQRVELTAEPIIQFAYKLDPSAVNAPNNALKSEWTVRNPTNPNIAYSEQRDDPLEMAGTLTVPARVVDEAGDTILQYRNLPNIPANFATTVTVADDEVSLLYRAGGFEANFLRGVGLILLQLIFLAALGVLAGSFATFPVACLICLAVLPFGLAGEFVEGAVKLHEGVIPSRTTTAIGYVTMKGMRLVFPNLAAMSPSQYLVSGIYIPWAELGRLSAVTLGVHTLLALGLACFIFHFRELATAQT